MGAQKFETKLETDERNHVRIIVPDAATEIWGKQARYYVKGTLNGVPFRGSLGARAGVFFMPVNKALQQETKITPGDTVQIIMELDAPEADTLPADFAQVLSEYPQVKQFLEELTPFQQNTYIKWIVTAKKAETRNVRVQEAVQLLNSGQKQR